MTERTVGYVLHSLEPDEEMAAAVHLESCAVCRNVAADVAEVTSGLARAVEQRDPPPRLRASIVDLARETPQVPAPEPPPVPAAGPAAPERAASGLAAGPRHRSSQRAGSRPDTGRPGGRSLSRFLSGRGSRLVAAVAAVVVLAGGGGLVVYAQQMRTERDASVAQSRDIFQMVSQFDRPGAQHAFLSTAASAQPVAAVMVNGQQREVMSVGLAPNALDRTYVLWGLNKDAAPQAVGTFDVHPTPESPVSVGSIPSGSFAQYAISLEPGRVAPAAPSSVIASGQVET